MADQPIGITFMPSADNQSMGPQNAALNGPGGDLAQAFKILSLRLPQVLGAGALSSPRLLNSQGSGGMPTGFNPSAAVYEALLLAMAGGGGAFAPPNGPSTTAFTPGGGGGTYQPPPLPRDPGMPPTPAPTYRPPTLPRDSGFPSVPTDAYRPPAPGITPGGGPPKDLDWGTTDPAPSPNPAPSSGFGNGVGGGGFGRQNRFV